VHSYVHHLGDWAAHTASLSWLESAAYHKLIEAYYIAERPLPGNVIELCRIIGALSWHQREAVSNVLSRYFTLEADGCFHQKRCDEELARHFKFRDSQKAKINKRWESHNAAKAIKETTKKATAHIVKNMESISNYRLTESLTNGSRALVQPDAVETDTNGMERKIPPELPIPYSGNRYKEQTSVTGETARRAAGVCREKGFEVKADEPRLVALVTDGATAGMFAEAASIAQAAGKPWGYVAGIVQNRLADALRMPHQATKSSAGPNYPPLPRWNDPH